MSTHKKVVLIPALFAALALGGCVPVVYYPTDASSSSTTNQPKVINKQRPVTPPAPVTRPVVRPVTPPVVNHPDVRNPNKPLPPPPAPPEEPTKPDHPVDKKPDTAPEKPAQPADDQTTTGGKLSQLQKPAS